MNSYLKSEFIFKNLNSYFLIWIQIIFIYSDLKIWIQIWQIWIQMISDFFSDFQMTSDPSPKRHEIVLKWAPSVWLPDLPGSHHWSDGQFSSPNRCRERWQSTHVHYQVSWSVWRAWCSSWWITEHGKRQSCAKERWCWAVPACFPGRCRSQY